MYLVQFIFFLLLRPCHGRAKWNNLSRRPDGFLCSAASLRAYPQNVYTGEHQVCSFPKAHDHSFISSTLNCEPVFPQIWSKKIWRWAKNTSAKLRASVRGWAHQWHHGQDSANIICNKSHPDELTAPFEHKHWEEKEMLMYDFILLHIK